MSNPSNPDRTKLAALLEIYGGSLKSFFRQRADCYEHQLYAQSLERLEQLYSEIFKPGQTLEAAREKCPPWPPGTRRAGELPSGPTLGKICERFNTEQALSSLATVSNFLDQVRKKSGALAIGEQKPVLDTVMTLVGQELVSERMKGGSLLTKENLSAADRLQFQQVLAQREDERRIKERALAQRIKEWEEKVAACKAAVAKELASAKTSGGISPETMEKIEHELKLL